MIPVGSVATVSAQDPLIPTGCPEVSVPAFIATAFAQDTPEAASIQWRAVADQIRPRVPKLAALLDAAEEDVLAYMTFPKEHRAKLHSKNPSNG
jgi:transposase-like protein